MGQQEQKSDEEESAGVRISLKEAFVFKLGRVLGGRSEVVKTPALELFGYMDSEMKRVEAEAEKERVRIFLNFLSNVYSQPSQGKDDAKFNRDRSKYIESITPDKQTSKAAPQSFDWDPDLMERIKQRQNGGKEVLNDGDDPGTARLIHSGSEGDQ